MTILFLLLSNAFADPASVTLREGQRAPFEGTLLNKEAVAEIISKNGAAAKQCEVDRDLALTVQSAKFESEKRVLNARIASCEGSLSSLEAENKLLIKKYNHLSSSIPYVAGGSFVGGILLTIAIANAVSGAN